MPFLLYLAVPILSDKYEKRTKKITLEEPEKNDHDHSCPLWFYMVSFCLHFSLNSCRRED